MFPTREVLQLIAQPADDQAVARRYVLWATAYDEHGHPLPEAIAHSYKSPTELRDFIISVCSAEELQCFNFEAISEQLCRGWRYSVDVSAHVAENLGFIITQNYREERKAAIR